MAPASLGSFGQQQQQMMAKQTAGLLCRHALPMI